MTTIAMPTLSQTAPAFMTFSLQHNTMRSESPLNKSIQTAEMPGARWVANFGWENLSDADARILKAWLNQLSGMAGRFYLHDYTHPIPAGTAAGTPLVKGAAQSGRTLLTDGWTPNQSGLLLPGDYFGVNGELKTITAPLGSNSGGECTLQFEPPLRTVPADNAPITINRPKCTMMLADDKQDSFSFKMRGWTGVNLNCLEAF